MSSSVYIVPSYHLVRTIYVSPVESLGQSKWEHRTLRPRLGPPRHFRSDFSGRSRWVSGKVEIFSNTLRSERSENQCL